MTSDKKALSFRGWDGLRRKHTWCVNFKGSVDPFAYHISEIAFWSNVNAIRGLTNESSYRSFPIALSCRSVTSLMLLVQRCWSLHDMFTQCLQQCGQVHTIALSFQLYNTWVAVHITHIFLTDRLGFMFSQKMTNYISLYQRAIFNVTCIVVIQRKTLYKAHTQASHGLKAV